MKGLISLPFPAVMPHPLLPAQVGLLDPLISRQLVVHLLNHIRSFSDWAQCMVLDIVTRYTPATEEERFDMLEVSRGGPEGGCVKGRWPRGRVCERRSGPEVGGVGGGVAPREGV